MCGIVGIIGQSAVAEVVRCMAGQLAHRGPDDEGCWVDADAGVALAHRRLAVVDLSPAGHQPMISACGRYILVLNGEIYNHAEMREELDAIGSHQWRGHSDTEVLLFATMHWGIRRAVERAVGMFAFALWDRAERKLVLGRDRLGEKPLYYGRIGSDFAFASELKAFRALPRWAPEINRDALTLLMRHNYIPAPYTIYRGFCKLEPGRLLTLDGPSGEPLIEAYWSASDVAERALRDPFSGTREEAVERLDVLLRQSLAGQMAADVPLGAFLSGGIDSSTIVATMQSMSSKPVRTFSIGFDEQGYDEAQHAKAVARYLGTTHTELYVTEREARDVIPSLPEMYCEPFSDSSQIPTFLVSRLARREVTVSLSGDAGDELFSGYTRYGVAASTWRKLSLIPQPLRRAAASLARSIPPAIYDTFSRPVMSVMPPSIRRYRVGDQVHKAASVLALQSVDEVYLRLCSHSPEPANLVIGGREPPTMMTGLAPIPAFDDPVRRMMHQDLISYLPDDILVKVDRAAMASSLETRVPFLDHRLVEFAMSLPLPILRSEGIPKWPLRQLLYKQVPRELVDRPKMGFGVPIDSWLRGDLRHWAEGLLSQHRLEMDGFFHPGSVRLAWDEHLSGRRNHQHILWDVLMFQAWLDAQRTPAARGTL